MADRDILDHFGQRIAKHRRDRGLTQDQLADKVGLSRGSISQIEAGTQDPGISGLITFARVFGVGVGELIDAGASTPDSGAWFELAKRTVTSERTYDGLALEAFNRNDMVAAGRNKAIADGIRIARDHHLSVITDLHTAANTNRSSR